MSSFRDISAACPQLYSHQRRCESLTFRSERAEGFQSVCLLIPACHLLQSEKIKSIGMWQLTKTYTKPHKHRHTHMIRVSHLDLVGSDAVNGVLFLLCAVGGVLPLCCTRGHVPVIGASAVTYSAPSWRQIWVQLQTLIIPDVICTEIGFLD